MPHISPLRCGFLKPLTRPEPKGPKARLILAQGNALGQQTANQAGAFSYHLPLTTYHSNSVNPRRSQQEIFQSNKPFHTNDFHVLHPAKIVGIVVMLNLVSLR